MKKSNRKKLNDKAVTKRQVKDMIKSTVKPVEKIVYTPNTNFTGSGTYYPVYFPAVGTGYNQSQGNNFVLKDLEIEFDLNVGTTEESSTPTAYPFIYRILVVQVFAPAYTTFPWSLSLLFNETGNGSVFTNQKTIASPLAYGVPDICHILMDLRDSLITFTPKASLLRKFKIKPRIRRIDYNNSLSEFEKGTIFVIPYLQYNTANAADWNAASGCIGSFSAALTFVDV